MVLRRVVPSALLNDNRVVIEGEANERLPRDYVYVSPTTRRVYDRGKGDTVSSLPADSLEVPKTTWWFKFWKRGEIGSSPPSNPQREGVGTPEVKPLETRPGQDLKWHETPEGVRRLKAEYLEMKRYFPDFELYQDDRQQMLWAGSIEGIGEIRIQYFSDRSKELFRLTAQNLTETQNMAIRQKIAEYQVLNITPTGALIVAMRYLLAERARENAVVPDSRREKETATRNKTDEQIRL
jgi:hypothetical protein